MFAKTLTVVLIPASSVLLLASPAQAQPRERSGAEIVKAQCVKSVSYTHLTLPTILRV